MQLMTADDTQITRKGKSFKLDMASSEDKPLTLILPWLYSKPKHVDKYVKLYHDQGIDVLKATLSPTELLRPKQRSKVVAANVLDFLRENPRYSRVVIHGFSVGGYLFCEIMVKMDTEPGQYGPLLDRIVGQIWDSVVDVSGLPIGVARSVTSNPVLQRALLGILEFFLWAAPQRKYYDIGSRTFHGGFCPVPSLFIGSKTDKISPPEMTDVAVVNFRNLGQTVFTKEFEKSPHVGHYSRHKEEYEEALHKFLQYINVTKSNQTATESNEKATESNEKATESNEKETESNENATESNQKAMQS